MQRIHSIELKHFKVFQDSPPIDLGGRNLLLYGPNGSGKSSIYWALYTFLQSSQKHRSEVEKYFDPSHPESLVNIDMGGDASSSIVLHIGQGMDLATTHPVRIALDAHETPVLDLQHANMASDFVTYRVLFRFFHFTNRDEIDLWPVFSREILPFCSAPVVGHVGNLWADVRSDDPYRDAQESSARGKTATKIYDEYDLRLGEVQVGLEIVLNSIQVAAQKFYTRHFARAGDKSLRIALSLARPPAYDRKQHQLVVPRIGMKITLDGAERPRPHSFLNEAKLTQIALSIRFGATKARLQDAPMKLLVLDDLLISLDMSNRTQVIKVILSDPDFSDYQKIIMTHDLGFYREVRRAIGADYGDWVFQRLHTSDGRAPSISDDPERIDWAASLMQEGRYDDAALQLRKASEDFLRDFVKKAYSSDKFVSLTTLLEDARSQNDLFLLKKLFAVLEEWDEEANDALDHLLPPNMDDLKNDGTLSEDERRVHCRRRAELRNLIKELHGHHRKTGRILEQIAHIKDRILNPAAHAGDPPLYASEIEDALDLLRRLKDALAVG